MIDGQRFLVIRFGTNIRDNCIEEHQKVISELGYCWFGKIGVVPTQKKIKEVLEAKSPVIVLYTKSHAYLCDLEAVSLEKPSVGTPAYYNDELFQTGKQPKSYYKLKSIEEISVKDLDRCVVVTTRSRLLDALNRSMSSYFYAELPDKNSKTYNQYKPRKDSEKDASKIDKNSCKYKVYGKCNLRSCVNYQYECERPSMCLKRK